MRELYNYTYSKRIFVELMLIQDYLRSDEYGSSIMTFAILYSLNTVPSVDSSIPVTIQPVVSHNMLNITVFVNVRKSLYVHIILCSLHFNQPKKHFCCVNNMLNRNISVGI